MPVRQLSDYRKRVEIELGLDASDAGEDQTEIDRFVNDGQEELLKRTKCQQRTSTMSLSSGVDEYTFDTATFLELLHVKTQGTGDSRNLIQVSMDEMLEIRTASAATGGPVQNYSFAGFDRFHVWPTPSSDEVLDVLYVPRASAMSASDDNPDSIPVDWHPLIEEYVLMRAARMDDDSTSGFGQSYEIQWERGIVRMKKAIRLIGGRTLTRAVVGNRNRAGIPQTNDIYP